MEVIERGTHLMKKVSRYWNIPFNSISDHLNGKPRCRKLRLALTKEEDVTIVAWILGMQECALLITLY